MARERVSIILLKDIAWLNKKVESRIYANRSHAKVLILEAMKKENRD